MTAHGHLRAQIPSCDGPSPLRYPCALAGCRRSGRGGPAPPIAGRRPAAAHGGPAARRRAAGAPTACPGPSSRSANLGLPDLPVAGASGGAAQAGSPTSLGLSGTHTLAGLVCRSRPRRGSPWSGARASPTSSATATTSGCGPARTSPRPTARSPRRAPDEGGTPRCRRPTCPRPQRGRPSRPSPRSTPTTEVTTAGTAVVAGRQAYELVLNPGEATRVAQVRIAVDAVEARAAAGAGLSTKLADPAFEVGFTAVDFAPPDAAPVRVHAAAGTTVTEVRRHQGCAGTGRAQAKPAAAAGRAQGRRHGLEQRARGDGPSLGARHAGAVGQRRTGCDLPGPAQLPSRRSPGRGARVA